MILFVTTGHTPAPVAPPTPAPVGREEPETAAPSAPEDVVRVSFLLKDSRCTSEEDDLVFLTSFISCPSFAFVVTTTR